MAYIGLGEMPRKRLSAQQIRENAEMGERSRAASALYEEMCSQARKKIGDAFDVTFEGDEYGGWYDVVVHEHIGEIDWDKVTPEQKTMFEATRDALIERLATPLLATIDPTAQDRQQAVSFRQIKSIEENN